MIYVMQIPICSDEVSYMICVDHNTAVDHADCTAPTRQQHELAHTAHTDHANHPDQIIQVLQIRNTYFFPKTFTDRLSSGKDLYLIPWYVRCVEVFESVLQINDIVEGGGAGDSQEIFESVLPFVGETGGGVRGGERGGGPMTILKPSNLFPIST